MTMMFRQFMMVSIVLLILVVRVRECLFRSVFGFMMLRLFMIRGLRVLRVALPTVIFMTFMDDLLVTVAFSVLAVSIFAVLGARLQMQLDGLFLRKLQSRRSDGIPTCQNVMVSFVGWSFSVESIYTVLPEGWRYMRLQKDGLKEIFPLLLLFDLVQTSSFCGASEGR